MKNSIFSTGKMVRLAVLVAILIVFCFTPLGRIPLGPVFITLNMLPVVIGAIVLGPAGGAILGTIFGLWSFSTCFGTDPFGTALVNQGFGTALLVAVMCIVPRFFAGWLPGFIYKALNARLGANEGGKIAAVALTSLSGSLLNTVLFVGALVLLFAKNPLTAEAFGTTNAWPIITALITSNALLEAVVCTVIGGAVARALIHFLPVKRRA
ncbi:MAG: ECF transporter S component [Oscillospiraceae bacterium]|jgi:uncharacterized membrane protein|nr:ECF transporter S component [Oscillospiraceae bacterium]